ncbi:MAG: DUF2279 domain-containing protein [Ekhidna sp.]|nr:DUF2279 domain-containing protein [Ekhidna sp.]
MILWGQDSLVNKKRLNTVLIGTGTLYTGSLIGLGTIWYEDLGRFHFFNDNDSWGYTDKLGHTTTAYQISRIGTDIFEWTGLGRKKSAWYAGTASLVFLTSVEVFDGMSDEWGFSLGDMAANTIGAAAFLSQELFWGEQKISLKYSYRKSPYAQYRPELLGSSTPEKWLKDYNAHIYWASANLKSLAFSASNIIPDWLNLALGYGIDGYTGGSSNPSENSKGESIPTFARQSQIYLSLDVDLTRIKTKSKFLRSAFNTLNILKIPLPGIEYNRTNGLRYHWFAF